MPKTRRFMVPVYASVQVRDMIEVDIPLEFLGMGDATEAEVKRFANAYVQNLLDDDGLTLDWKIETVNADTIRAGMPIEPVYRCACSWVGGDPDERPGKPPTCPACWHHDRKRVEVKAGTE